MGKLSTKVRRVLPLSIRTGFVRPVIALPIVVCPRNAQLVSTKHARPAPPTITNTVLPVVGHAKSAVLLNIKPRRARPLPTRTGPALHVTISPIAVWKRPVPAAPTSNVLSAQVGTTGKVLRAARLVLFVLPRSTKPQSAPLLPIRTGFAHLVKISLIVVSQKNAIQTKTKRVLSVLYISLESITRAAHLVKYVVLKSSKLSHAR